MTQFPSVYRKVSIEQENQQVLQRDRQSFPDNSFSQAFKFNGIPFGLPREQGGYQISNDANRQANYGFPSTVNVSNSSNNANGNANNNNSNNNGNGHAGISGGFIGHDNNHLRNVQNFNSGPFLSSTIMPGVNLTHRLNPLQNNNNDVLRDHHNHHQQQQHHHHLNSAAHPSANDPSQFLNNSNSNSNNNNANVSPNMRANCSSNGNYGCDNYTSRNICDQLSSMKAPILIVPCELPTNPRSSLCPITWIPYQVQPPSNGCTSYYSTSNGVNPCVCNANDTRTATNSSSSNNYNNNNNNCPSSCNNNNSNAKRTCERCGGSINTESGFNNSNSNSNNNNGIGNNNNNNSLVKASDNLRCINILSVQLQAIVAQLLDIESLVSSTISQFLLKHIPQTRIVDSLEDIMNKSLKAMQRLSVTQLLKESKCCQEISILLKVYLISETNSNYLIPILTSATLRLNVLKSAVDCLINARIAQDQGCSSRSGGGGGGDAEEPLDEILLNSKTEVELLQLLAILKDKECQSRVELNFSPYGSQRFVLQSRLTNVRRKICQIERELKRRRDCSYEAFNNYRSETNVCNTNDKNTDGSSASSNTADKTCGLDYQNVFDDFTLERPKKLLLKPHVGSPGTTYENNDTNQQKSDHLKSSSM